MFKKTLFATATAALLAMAALPTAASADSVPRYHGGNNGGDWNGNGGDWDHHRGGPGWGFSFSFGQPTTCGFRTVKWWDSWGNPHWSKVANPCPAPRYYGWNSGWGNGWGNGYHHHRYPQNW